MMYVDRTIIGIKTFCRRQDGKSDKSIAVVGYTKPKPNIVTILEHTSGNEEVKS